MISYRDIASKNVFGFIPIERKQVLEKAKEVKATVNMKCIG